MALDVKLVVVGGDVKTTELRLRLPSTIGRGRGTNIVLPHPLVSRQHCELFEADGQLMVRDLGSLNGTFVNNQRITESPLPPGELLTIGTVTFRALYEATGEAGRVVPAAGAGPSDKTVPASKSATIRTAPKTAAPAESVEANSDSEVLEFNFGQPLLPEDDEEASVAAHPTERLTETIEQAQLQPNKQVQPNKAGRGSPEPLGKEKTSADDDQTIRAETDAETDDEASSQSDDDLDDFLKSLGNNA